MAFLTWLQVTPPPPQGTAFFETLGTSTEIGGSGAFCPESTIIFSAFICDFIVKKDSATKLGVTEWALNCPHVGF